MDKKGIIAVIIFWSIGIAICLFEDVLYTLYLLALITWGFIISYIIYDIASEK